MSRNLDEEGVAADPEKMRTKHVFHGSAMDVPDGGEALPEDEDLPDHALPREVEAVFFYMSLGDETGSRVD